MNEFAYCIEVSFLNDQCLGKDLAVLLKVIPNLSGGEWYLFDVQTNNNSNTESIQNILRTNELIIYSMNVDQFFSGDFLYFSNQCISKKNVVIETEDEKYRNPLNANLEIRAFDTTCFEIYTSDYQQVEWIKEKLKFQNISFNFNARI